ncbi:hypothetical protein L596_010546 [Steinernema carpocapsae]|uniref:Uncharacterized protein n=1 Tax=Steinernema carpocapsae TaxID=34508 RepID=A0A4U5PK12_STECR|nr:hypothetical protein L596_010546 [Steinernema carpocapsae]
MRCLHRRTVGFLFNSLFTSHGSRSRIHRVKTTIYFPTRNVSIAFVSTSFVKIPLRDQRTPMDIRQQ